MDGVDAEKRLARAVIARAVIDARQGPTDRARMARAWLLHGGNDLALWCGIAGVGPERLRRALGERGDEGER